MSMNDNTHSKTAKAANSTSSSSVDNFEISHQDMMTMKNMIQEIKQEIKKNQKDHEATMKKLKQELNDHARKLDSLYTYTSSTSNQTHNFETSDIKNTIPNDSIQTNSPSLTQQNQLLVERLTQVDPNTTINSNKLATDRQFQNFENSIKSIEATTKTLASDLSSVKVSVNETTSTIEKLHSTSDTHNIRLPLMNQHPEISTKSILSITTLMFTEHKNSDSSSYTCVEQKIINDNQHLEVKLNNNMKNNINNKLLRNFHSPSISSILATIDTTFLKNQDKQQHNCRDQQLHNPNHQKSHHNKERNSATQQRPLRPANISANFKQYYPIIRARESSSNNTHSSTYICKRSLLNMFFASDTSSFLVFDHLYKIFLF